MSTEKTGPEGSAARPHSEDVMNSRVRLATVLAAGMAWIGAAVALAGEPAAAPPPDKKGSPTKIGFANIKNIIDQYKRTLTLEKDIDRFREEESDKTEQLRKRVKEKRDELKMLNQGSRLYYETWKEIRKLELDINFQDEALKGDLQLRLLKATKDVYEDILKEIQDYAGKNDYLVIFKVESGDLESESKAELILRINSRGVLYYAPSLDISEEIIKSLNAKYTGGKEEPPKKEEGTKAEDPKKDEGTKAEGTKTEGTVPPKEPEKKTETPPGSKAGN
jgi:Skp family chaperone for outer membrane proteins